MVCCACMFSNNVEELDGAARDRKAEKGAGDEGGPRANVPPTDENNPRGVQEAPEDALANNGNNAERPADDGDWPSGPDYCRGLALRRFSNLRSTKQIETVGGSALFELSDTLFIVRLRHSIDPVVTQGGPGLPETPQVELASVVRGPRDWITSMAITPATLAGIARTIGRCIDTVLYPVIERGIDAPRRAAESKGEKLSIDDYVRSCQVAVANVSVGEITRNRRISGSYSPQAAVSVCVSAGLLALGWISGVLPLDSVSSPEAYKIPASTLHVSSVNTLFSLLADLTPTSVEDEKSVIGFLSTIGILPGYTPCTPSSQIAHAPDDDDELLNLSWLRHVPYYALMTPAKGMLLAMHCAVRNHNQPHVQLSVPRGMSTTFRYVHEEVRRHGLLPAEPEAVQHSHGTTCRALRVRTDADAAESPGTLSGEDAQDAGLAIAAPSKATRALFDALAEEMMSSWTETYVCGEIGPTTPTLRLQESSSHVIVTIPNNCSQRPQFAAGCRVTVSQLSDLYQHEHFRVQDTLVLVCNEVVSPPDVVTDADGNEMGIAIKLKCNRISPLTADNLRFTISQPMLPLFKQDRMSSSSWFNCATPDESKDDWVNKFAFAGWLIASAIATGATLPVALPPVFFVLLREWPNFKPAEEDLLSLGSLSKASLQSLKDMSPEALAEVAQMQGLPADCGYDEYIEHFCKEVLVNQVRTQASACVNAFHATGLRSNVIFRHTSAEDLCTIVCGREENIDANYYLRYEFRVYEDEAFDVYTHNHAFLDVVWNVLDNQLDSASGKKTYDNKRKLLKFLTGRAALPSNHRQETFRLVLENVETSLRGGAAGGTRGDAGGEASPVGAAASGVPHASSSSHVSTESAVPPLPPALPEDYQRLLDRLPHTHTCDVTLEIPNYAEAVIFAPSSPWYGLKERSLAEPITHADRLAAWQDLKGATATVFETLRQKIVDTTVSKITQAILAVDAEDRAAAL